MKKSGWDQTSLRVCGYTPKLYYAMGADVTRLWTRSLFLDQSWKVVKWITDTNVTLKENDILEALDYEIDVPVHWSGDCFGSQHRRTSTASS